jgi:hypothetical protein
MPLKPFLEMMKVPVPAEQRDGANYLSWANCKRLLHENGAEKVYFEPMVNANGSSLFMANVEFKDKNEVVNRCYEVRVKVVIDDLVFEYQTPVMNGGNPVKDNSMSQQRVWNAQTRAFVKGVAVHTGLGFNLWLDDEDIKNVEEDPSRHSLKVIKKRIDELITLKMKVKGLSQKELCDAIGWPEKIFVQTMEKAFANIDSLELALNKL